MSGMGKICSANPGGKATHLTIQGCEGERCRSCGIQAEQAVENFKENFHLGPINAFTIKRNNPAPKSKKIKGIDMKSLIKF